LTLPQGIIDFAFSPPIGVLNPHLDTAGPYGSGNHTLTTWTPSGFPAQPVANTYGVMVQFNGAIPPKLGLIPGYDDGALIVTDFYEFRLVQLVVQHQFLGGAWTVTQIEQLHVLPFTIRWQEATPGRVGLFVLAGIQVDLFYLQVT